jgi:hypothetical protein
MQSIIIVLNLFLLVIAPTVAFTYRFDSNTKQYSGQLIRHLQVLGGENPDGTILVAVDEKWPPVRIARAVQSLLDCNLTYPDRGFKPGSFLSIESSLFQRITNPTILESIIQTPSNRFSHAIEPNENEDNKHGSDGIDIRSAASSGKSFVAAAEKMDVGLRGTVAEVENRCPFVSVRAPILLSFSYYGPHNPKVGGKMTWVYSIMQGSVPLSGITLRFLDPSSYLYSQILKISHNLSVPWNLQSTGTVTNGSFTYKVSGSEPSGTYQLLQIVLTTEACPVCVTVTLQHKQENMPGYVSYAHNTIMSTVIGPLTHSLQILSSNAASFVFGAGLAASSNLNAVPPPELIEFKYIGNYSVAWGDDLVWEYKVAIMFVHPDGSCLSAL